MENHSSSHPNSRDSSPSSRELLENDHPASFDEPPPSNTKRVKLICSFGGRIQPRLHERHFSYIGGDTKILAVDRNVKLPNLIGKLTAMADSDVCFKYQLPGEDLDALISVCNEDDLDYMMIEYDRMCRASPKPARLRLFLFPSPVKNNSGNVSFDSTASASAMTLAAAEDSKSESQWFVDALNSVNVPPFEDSFPPPPPPPTMNPDYLFGLDKPYSPSPEAKQAEFAENVPDFAAKDTECELETVREAEIQEIQSVEPVNDEQKMNFDGENGGVNDSVDCYTQENTETEMPLVTNVLPVQAPNPAPVHSVQSGSVQFQVPGPVSVQSSFSPMMQNGVSAYSTGYPNEPAPVSPMMQNVVSPYTSAVYLIQTPSGLYQAVRPVTGPTGEPVYFAYTQIGNKFGYNGSGAPGVISERGYSNVSYLPDMAVFPSQAAVAGVDSWN